MVVNLTVTTVTTVTSMILQKYFRLLFVVCQKFIIFVAYYANQEDMRIQKILHNSLKHRELPPPFAFCNVSNNHLLRSANPTLLHQAFAFCGRALYVCLFLMLPSIFMSCEKPEWTEDEVTRSNDEQNDSTANGSINITIVPPEWGGTREYNY